MFYLCFMVWEVLFLSLGLVFSVDLLEDLLVLGLASVCSYYCRCQLYSCSFFCPIYIAGELGSITARACTSHFHAHGQPPYTTRSIRRRSLGIIRRKRLSYTVGSG